MGRCRILMQRQGGGFLPVPSDPSRKRYLHVQCKGRAEESWRGSSRIYGFLGNTHDAPASRAGWGCLALRAETWAGAFAPSAVPAGILTSCNGKA